MYAGRLLEAGHAADVLRTPRHPYTSGLVRGHADRSRSAAPSERLIPIPGQPPDIGALPPGCPFAPRCPHARPDCAAVPMVLDVAPPGHGSACPFVERPAA